MEFEDTFKSAHRRETVCVPFVRGHVQAESPFVEAFVFGASQCDKYARIRRPVQLLFLFDVV